MNPTWPTQGLSRCRFGKSCTSGSSPRTHRTSRRARRHHRRTRFLGRGHSPGHRSRSLSSVGSSCCRVHASIFRAALRGTQATTSTHRQGEGADYEYDPRSPPRRAREASPLWLSGTRISIRTAVHELPRGALGRTQGCAQGGKASSRYAKFWQLLGKDIPQMAGCAMVSRYRPALLRTPGLPWLKLPPLGLNIGP